MGKSQRESARGWLGRKDPNPPPGPAKAPELLALQRTRSFSEGSQRGRVLVGIRSPPLCGGSVLRRVLVKPAFRSVVGAGRCLASVLGSCSAAARVMLFFGVPFGFIYPSDFLGAFFAFLAPRIEAAFPKPFFPMSFSTQI